MTDNRVYEGDEAIVEAMLEARFLLAVGQPLPDAWASYEVAGMTAALRVARESLWEQWAQENLGPVTDEERIDYERASPSNPAFYSLMDINMLMASRASAPPAPQDAKPPNTLGDLLTPRRKVWTPEKAISRLREIHSDVQGKWHDQWNWMDADFCVEVLRCAIEAAKPQIVSSCYGDLVRSHPAVAELISPEEWDNLSASEQRDWALDRIAAKPAERELTDAEWRKVFEAWYKSETFRHIWSSSGSTGLDAIKAAYAEIKRILNEPAVDPRWEAYRAANDRLLELRGNVDRLTPEQWEELRRLMPEEGK